MISCNAIFISKLSIILSIVAVVNGYGQINSINFDAFESASITNLEKLNTRYIEFAPSLYKDGIVFVSSSGKVKKIDKKTRESFFDLKYCNLAIKEVSVIKLSENIGNEYHLGPCAFNKDQTIMYYSQSDVNNKASNGRYQMKLSIAQLKNEEWIEKEDFLYNDPEYSILHPTISQNGEFLIFSSNMPGGYGKWDLYISNKSGASWSRPKNLGPYINSEENDMFPHIYKDKWLFYSSNGIEGYGGFDVYISKFQNDRWIFPENLGNPINSEKDDMGLILNETAQQAYLSSNRKGGKGKDDIYVLDFTEDIFIEEIPIVERKKFTELEINVLDKNTNLPIDEAGILFIPKKIETKYFLEDSKPFFRPDIYSYKKLSSSVDINEVKTDTSGKAKATLEETVEYRVAIMKEGYVYEQTRFDPSALIPEIYILLDPVEYVTHNGIQLPVTPGEVIIFDKLEFSLIQPDSLPIYKEELKALAEYMTYHPELKLDIMVHTDAQKDDYLSLGLSENHAELIHNYLSGKGIPLESIKVKGLGESEIRNSCKNGVSCSQQEHAVNNRIEIRIQNK